MKHKTTHAGAVIKTGLILFTLLLCLQQNSYAIQTIYTIQAGSFKIIDDAQKQFDSIVEKTNKETLDNLRIEKIGDYFSVRIGKFESYSIALKSMQKIKSQLSNAIIITAYIKDERIIRLYSAPLATKKDEPEQISLSDLLPKKIKPQEIYNAEAHERKGDKYLENNRSFLAIEEYRRAIKQGVNDPKLFWKLASVLYSMGFVDDAIIEMEKAVDLSSSNEFYRVDLCVLYLAKGRLEKAKKQLLAALEINPGHTAIYNYLGELFLRTEEYDMAWLSVKMANRLGNTGQDIIRKLGALSREPDVNPWEYDGEDLYIRQILVDTSDKAQDIVKRISEGELFENIAFKESTGPNAEKGGFIGRLKPYEIDSKIADALLSREILSDPLIVETEKGFHIVQRIVPFDLTSWKNLLAGSDRAN
jgi:peptidyl-prolyl cis-trans isomerase C